MKKVALVFVLAVFVPSLILAWLAVRSLRDQEFVLERQQSLLYQGVADSLAKEADAFLNERQHEFVMLRARLAYTIARHGLRSLDQIEKLLLQVTRKNDPRGYERFKDLFEAIVAYNE